MNEPVVWLADGSPHSPRFNDRYHSRAGGLAQAETVFLHGCGLPDAWRGKSDFSILETGFGLGLNFLTTWASWEADAGRSDRLHFYSIEGYPVASEEIFRNAKACIEAADGGCQNAQQLQTKALALANNWKKLASGVQVFGFADGRVQLTLAVGDVLPMLEAIDCHADAVYLDGFSPAVNSEMWSPSTLAAVSEHCHRGARIATYTVARTVRAALTTAGFSVVKCPGLAPKRDRLEGAFGSSVSAIAG
jgi:tRNA 5-methylaminomethyl-2-thiouridine biosynthesis bifunctional protein